MLSIGSLSKSIWGGLRIGWLRGPAPLVTRLARLRAVADLGGNVPAQLAAAELVTRLDSLDVGTELKSRHDHLRAQLAGRLPSWAVPSVRGGQTLWVQLPDGDGNSFAQTAMRHGIAVLPGSGLDATGQSEAYLRLHFRARPEELTEAVRRLASAWQAYRPPTGQVSTRPVIAI